MHADEEDAGIPVRRVGVGNERIAGFDARDKPVLQEEFERPIDRGRAEMLVEHPTKPVHDIIGAQWPTGFTEHFEHSPTHVGEAGISLRANALCLPDRICR